MHRPLGRATLVVQHRSPSLGLRLSWRSLGRSLVVMRKHDSASSYLSHFGRRQNATNALRPLPRKNSLNNSFFFFWRRNIFLKRYIFNSFRVGEGKRIKTVAENTKWLKPDDCDCRGRDLFKFGLYFQILAVFESNK